MKGWFKESWRHKLARLGISTTGPNLSFRSMETPLDNFVNSFFDDSFARKSAKSMIQTFGDPDASLFVGKKNKHNRLQWFNREWGGMHWESIELRNEAIPHSHPALHKDFLYGTIKMEVPDFALKEIAGKPRFASVQYDDLKKLLTVRCAFMTKNVWTVRKVKEVIEQHKMLESELKKMDQAQAKAPATNKRVKI